MIDNTRARDDRQRPVGRPEPRRDGQPRRHRQPERRRRHGVQPRRRRPLDDRHRRSPSSPRAATARRRSPTGRATWRATSSSRSRQRHDRHDRPGRRRQRSRLGAARHRQPDRFTVGSGRRVGAVPLPAGRPGRVHARSAPIRQRRTTCRGSRPARRPRTASTTSRSSSPTRPATRPRSRSRRRRSTTRRPTLQP